MFKKSKIIYILIFTIIIVITVIYVNNSLNFKKFIDNIEKESIDVNKYYVYGTHLNIEGSINKKFSNIKDIKLIIKSKNDTQEYDIHYTINDKLTIYISNKINEGINLEKIKNGKYYILLKIIYSDNKIEHYSFKNNTSYKSIDYYSLNNHKIIINFDEYMNLLSKKIKKEKDIYDIVIDAGHGGYDPGAINGNYKEADLTLEYALSLKEKLEKLGYKVKLTRDKNISIKTYGKNSRTSIPYDTKAKYLFSIHLNSSEIKIKNSGVEVYAPTNCNLDFATSLADNIVNDVGIKYSLNDSFKIKNGVYVKTFTKDDIKASNEEAYKNKFNPYNINIYTPYLYILRETGGFMTNAYVDGRNKKYEKNEYYNSNIGIESYLLELGYINNNDDLEILLNNKQKYVNSISKTIDNYIKSNS